LASFRPGTRKLLRDYLKKGSGQEGAISLALPPDFIKAIDA
jgi:hypothetical protein